MPLALSLGGDLSALAADRELVLIPTNTMGVAAALRLRRQLLALGYPRTLLAAPSRAACTSAAVDCVHIERFGYVHGEVTRVLLAKVYALAFLFSSGHSVLALDSDVTAFHPVADLWRSELAPASLVVQQERGIALNSGVVRVQHVERLTASGAAASETTGAGC